MIRGKQIELSYCHDAGLIYEGSNPPRCVVCNAECGTYIVDEIVHEIYEILLKLDAKVDVLEGLLKLISADLSIMRSVR